VAAELASSQEGLSSMREIYMYIRKHYEYLLIPYNFGNPEIVLWGRNRPINHNCMKAKSLCKDLNLNMQQAGNSAVT
jgi:hypothetical protein